MKMDLERIGSRHRGTGTNSQHFAAESEELDQIAKEVSLVTVGDLIAKLRRFDQLVPFNQS